MERRGFLGALLSFPIIAGMKPKSTESPLTVEEAEKVLNTRIDDPVWDKIPMCSGIYPTTHRIVGVIPENDGTQTWVYRNEDGVYDQVTFKTEIH